MLRTVSINAVALAAPIVGTSSSRHLATTSSRVIGLSDVPRTAPTRSVRVVRSVSVTSTIVASRIKSFECLVRYELYLGTFSEDGRGLHSGAVVRGGKRGGLVEQHDGDHVLQGDVRHLAVVHRLGFARGDPDDDAPDLRGIERSLLTPRKVLCRYATVKGSRLRLEGVAEFSQHDDGTHY